MKRWKCRAAIIIAVCAARTSVGGQGVGAGEEGLRRAATNSPRPVYPEGALRRKASGVAVVSLQSSPEGSVTLLTVLQSPDPEIGEAVRAAVAKWRFSPAQVLGRTESLGRRGKLTFYFRIRNGAGVVLSPDELPEAERPPIQSPRPAGSGSPPAGPPATPPAVRTMAPGSHDAAPEIGEAEFNRLMAGSPRPFLLDPRDRDEFGRDHRAGAINLPYDEVNMRGRAELPRDRDMIVDCSLGNAFPCQVASSRLLALGFTRVKVFIP